MSTNWIYSFAFIFALFLSCTLETTLPLVASQSLTTPYITQYDTSVTDCTVTFDPFGGTLFGACQPGIVVIQVQTNIITNIEVCNNPQSLYWEPISSSLFVVCPNVGLLRVNNITGIPVVSTVLNSTQCPAAAVVGFPQLAPNLVFVVCESLGVVAITVGNPSLSVSLVVNLTVCQNPGSLSLQKGPTGFSLLATCDEPLSIGLNVGPNITTADSVIRPLITAETWISQCIVGTSVFFDSATDLIFVGCLGTGILSISPPTNSSTSQLNLVATWEQCQPGNFNSFYRDSVRGQLYVLCGEGIISIAPDGTIVLIASYIPFSLPLSVYVDTTDDVIYVGSQTGLYSISGLSITTLVSETQLQNPQYVVYDSLLNIAYILVFNPRYLYALTSSSLELVPVTNPSSKSSPFCNNVYQFILDASSSALYLSCFYSGILLVPTDSAEAVVLLTSDQCPGATFVAVDPTTTKVFAVCSLGSTSIVALLNSSQVVPLVNSTQCPPPILLSYDPLSGLLIAACSTFLLAINVTIGVFPEVAISQVATVSDCTAITTNSDVVNSINGSRVEITVYASCSLGLFAISSSMEGMHWDRVTLSEQQCSAVVVDSQRALYALCQEGIVYFFGALAQGSFQKTVIPSSTLCSGGSSVDVNPTSGAIFAVCDGEVVAVNFHYRCLPGMEWIEGSCDPCPLGTSQNSSLAMTPQCTPCFSGTTAAALGTSSCMFCGPGTFAQTTVVGCQECPIGTYSSATANSYCSSCEAGTYGNETSRTSPSCNGACYPGYWCPQGSTSPFQISCGASSVYCPSGSSAPLVVAPGNFTTFPADPNNPTGTRTAQVPCQIGSYCDGSGTNHSCIPGTFSNTTALSVCYLCPISTFSNSSAASSCYTCPIGSSAPSSGSTSCQGCQAGTISTSIGCQPCSQGSISSSSATHCKICSAGEYTMGLGGVQCLQCPTGQYSPYAGYNDSCILCPAGSYSLNASGSSVCSMCQPGWFCPAGANFNTRVACGSRSQYCPGNTTSAMNVPSAEGVASYSTLCSADGPSLCSNYTICPLGYSCQAGIPTICLAGYFANHTGLSQCYPCSIGTYSSQQGLSFCTNCTLGTTTSTVASITCIGCGIGEFASSADGCQLCAYGHYSVGGTTSCETCPSGTYTPQRQTSSCLDCQSGRYNPSSGLNQSSCFECIMGSASLNDSSSVGCTECPPGFYCPLGSSLNSKLSCASSSLYCPGNTTDAVNVPTGAYAIGCDSDGVSHCTNFSVCERGSLCQGGVSGSCPLGQYGNVTGLTACFDCPLGTFSSSAGSSSCTPCSPGSYTLTTGSVLCIQCIPGTYLGTNGSSLTSCVRCPQGTFAAHSGSSSCYPCGPGQYTPTNGSVSCIGCVPGQANIGPNNTCKDCNYGFYTDVSNSQNCTACEPGTYTTQQGSVACIPCASGYYTNISGWPFPKCASCPEGTQSLRVQGSTGCVECIPGFANGSPNSPCLQCPLGTSAASNGSTVCKLCSPGTYAGVPGSSSCETCVQGWVNPHYGSPGCTQCPDQSYANPGQTECINNGCASGQGYDSSAGICYSCPPNTMSQSDGIPCSRSILKSSCPSNTYAPAWGSFGCIDCTDAVGFDCPNGVAITQPNYWAYLVVNTAAQPNFYSPNTTIAGRIEMRTSSCPAGFCVGGGSVVMLHPLTKEDIVSPIFFSGPCESNLCPINPTMVVNFVPDSGNGTVDDTDADAIATSPCDINRDPSPGNVLCGNCVPDTVEWQGSCVDCPNVKADVLFVCLLFSFVFVFILYRLSQKSRSDGKILVYFIQTALFQLGAEDDYVGWLGLVNFNLFQTSGSSCLGPLTEYQYLAMSAMIPIFFLFELIIFMGIHWMWRSLKHSARIGPFIAHSLRRVRSLLPLAGEETSIDKERRFAIDVGFPFQKYSRTASSLLCFGYLQIATSCINYLNCVSVDGEVVVFSSPAINCNSSAYQDWLTVVLILLVVEVCIFPLVLFVFLYRNRHRLFDADFLSRFGILYESYDHRAWFWQPVVLVRQVLLIGISTTFTTNHYYQFTSFVYFNLAVYGIHVWFLPNARAMENRLEAASHMLLVILTVLLTATNPPYSYPQQVLVCLLVIPFAAFALLLVGVARSKMKQVLRIAKWMGIDELKDDEGPDITTTRKMNNEHQNVYLGPSVVNGTLSPTASALSPPCVNPPRASIEFSHVRFQEASMSGMGKPTRPGPPSDPPHAHSMLDHLRQDSMSLSQSTFSHSLSPHGNGSYAGVSFKREGAPGGALHKPETIGETNEREISSIVGNDMSELHVAQHRISHTDNPLLLLQQEMHGATSATAEVDRESHTAFQ